MLPLGGPVWSSSLVRALGVLGLQEKTARQAIARGAADGWLEREKVGREVRWALSPATTNLLQEGARRIYTFKAVTDGWDGRWLLVRLNVPEERRDHRHRLRTQLAWAGFGSLGQGLHVSPHAGQHVAHASALTFVVEPRSREEDCRLVAEAWGDRGVLRDAYTAFIAEVRRTPADATGEAAFVAQSRMVHEWRRFPFLDPELPRELLPDDWVGLEAAALFAERHEAWSSAARDWFCAAP